jgi:hypothetical protein
MDENLKIEEWIENNGGRPDWKAIAVYLGHSEDDSERIRQRYKHFRSQRGDFKEKDGKYRATYQRNGDGTVSSDRLIAMSEEDSKDPRRVVELHGFDPDEWVLIDVINNYWQMMKSHKTGGGSHTLYQSKIRLRPRNPDEITLKDIDAFFEGYTPPKLAPKAKRKEQDGQLLEIVLGDMHLDGDSNGNITKRLKNTITGIERISENISEIALIPIGDIFHYDTYQKTTTGGTQIEPGNMGHQKMFDLGEELMLHAVDSLKRIAPITTYFVPGNHDYTYSYMLLKSIDNYYRNDENVTVDCGHYPRKAVLWGENLIVWAHGDVAKSRIADLPQVEFREWFGKAKCVELHAGHWHSQQTFEKGGVIVRQ